MSPTEQIVRLAIITRIFIIALQLISNFLIPDHDAGVFVSPKEAPLANQTICNRLIEPILGGFRRWDAEYFLHIAEHGYTYENTLAFYPLYPFCVRYTTYLIQLLIPIPCSMRDLILLVGIALNIGFFTKAAITLFRLTERIFDNQRYARMVVTLFCFNPASIFFTAPYTESLFCWLTFDVMLKCVQNRIFAALIPMVFSMWCRSNGIINFGIIVYFVLANAFKSNQSLFIGLMKSIPKLIFYGIEVAIAFAMPQIYYYFLYCTEHQIEMTNSVQKYGIDNQFRMTGHFSRDVAPWCSYSLPFSYSYVQSNYWNVGFLRYYEFKQMPNFLLAAPILSLLISFTLRFLMANPQVTLKLGFSKVRNSASSQFVFVVHVFALSLFCVFFVHIQVSTRMLASSSPMLYWICAQCYCRENTRLQYVNSMLKPKSKPTKFISYWFFSYLVIGTVLFCNFLPWT